MGHVYDDAAEMFGNEEIDFVDIITGVDTHYKFVEMAADVGIKHIICQKPMAADWDTAKKIMTDMYPAIHSMESGNYNQKAKIGCLRGTFDAGPVRLPLANLSDSEKQAFLALLK